MEPGSLGVWGGRSIWALREPVPVASAFSSPGVLQEGLETRFLLGRSSPEAWGLGGPGQGEEQRRTQKPASLGARAVQGRLAGQGCGPPRVRRGEASRLACPLCGTHPRWSTAPGGRPGIGIVAQHPHSVHSVTAAAGGAQGGPPGRASCVSVALSAKWGVSRVFRTCWSGALPSPQQCPGVVAHVTAQEAENLRPGVACGPKKGAVSSRLLCGGHRGFRQGGEQRGAQCSCRSLSSCP